MKIIGKSVRSLVKLISNVGKVDDIRLACDVTNATSDKWISIGFDPILEVGQSLIPACIGRVTAFNANGQEIVRKDLPMKPQPRSFYTTWQDWHHKEHSGIQTRYIDMYPRECVPAPSESLHVVEMNGRMLIATRETTLADENEVGNLHLANFMLECFGEFEAVDVTSGLTVGAKLKRLQWDILPPGEYPWARTKELIGAITGTLNKSDKEVVESRLRAIARYEPDFLATGRGGFSGYFVHGFSKRGIYVLESIHLDNATYIFKDNWEEFSRLTKNQIINGEIPHRRLVHDKAWLVQLRASMAKEI